MQLVIFTGLQASGKTSFYHVHFASTHVHVSRDNFRHNKNPLRRQTQLILEAFAQERSVVVDNTNPTPADRLPLIELARNHGAEVVGYYFESRIEDCLQRNALRQGKAHVPDVALRVTLAKLQRPLYQEGFDQLYDVRMTDDGWQITDWREEDETT